jgi:Bacterial membrane protein YfhO
MASTSSAKERVNKPKANIRSASTARVVVDTPLFRFKLWQVALVFLGLTLIFHSAILFGGKFLWEDFVEQEFPFRTLAASSLAQGILPHWNPYVFAGMPFLADVQVAFWYPINLLQSLFVSDGHLSPLVMEWAILLHFFVAGFGMYWFSKKIFELDDWSAIFAGIAYGFSGYIAAQSIHQMIVYHIALFPFVAYFFIRGFDSWKHAIVSGLILGTMYLAGHPQSTLYFTFFLAVLALYELVHRARHKSGALNIATIVRMALPVIIGFGIFAIQFLPSQELANLSRRDTITYEKSLDGSLTWGHILTFVLPRLFGVTNGAGDAKVPYWNGAYYLSWETAIYIGVLPLFFAIMAGLLTRKKKYVPLFAGMALLAVAFALGDHFFLYRIFFQFPLFNKFRTPARMMMLFSFAASALAGVGLADALKAAGKKWGDTKGLVVRAALVVPWLLAIAGMIHATSFLKAAPEGADDSISWAASLATLPVLALIAITGLHYFGQLRGNLFAILVIAVTGIELFNYGMTLNASPEDPRDAFRQQPALVTMLQQDEAKEFSRARTRIGGQMLVKRNQGAYDRIHLIEGYDPLVLQRVFPDMANPDHSMDLMNVKWTITTGANPGFVERPTYMPRTKLYYQADILPGSQALIRIKTDSSYDYRNRILLEEPLTMPLGAFDSTAKASITKYEDNEITAQVTTASNAMLFFSEIYYPAWKAYLDGHPVKLYRAFTSLRAVEVPAGTHTIVLRYESNAFAMGSMITIITLILSLGGLAILIVFGRRSRLTKPEATA